MVLFHSVIVLALGMAYAKFIIIVSNSNESLFDKSFVAILLGAAVFSCLISSWKALSKEVTYK